MMHPNKAGGAGLSIWQCWFDPPQPIFFFFSANWCNILAFHFISQRWLWLLNTGNSPQSIKKLSSYGSTAIARMLNGISYL
jgi:hypothetical protein